MRTAIELFDELNAQDESTQVEAKGAGPINRSVMESVCAFHETNLAETKGTGIRAMRKLLEEAHLAPPTFESDRMQDQFTARLLLHHFLSEGDLAWLGSFSRFDLNDNQKRGLIMLRELRAIDNSSYRQQSGLDTLAASQELRSMRDMGLLEMKGKGSATYYVPGSLLSTGPEDPSTASPGLKTPPPSLKTPPPSLKTPPSGENTQPQAADIQHLGINAQPGTVKTPPRSVKTPPPALDQGPSPQKQREVLLENLDAGLRDRLERVGRRTANKTLVEDLVVDICRTQPFSKEELARLFNKREHYFRIKYINPLVSKGRLTYRYPEVLNHPDQAYVATGK